MKTSTIQTANSVLTAIRHCEDPIDALIGSLTAEMDPATDGPVEKIIEAARLLVQAKRIIREAIPGSR